MYRPRALSSYFYERKCYLCERRTVYPDQIDTWKPQRRVRFIEPIPIHHLTPPGFCIVEQRSKSVKQKSEEGRMMRSASPQYPSRTSDIRVIRLTEDQEAVLQEQFNRWPRAPHTADVVLLAAETGLSEADVEAWYAIRLAQWRKEQGLGGNLGLH